MSQLENQPMTEEPRIKGFKSFSKKLALTLLGLGIVGATAFSSIGPNGAQGNIASRALEGLGDEDLKPDFVPAFPDEDDMLIGIGDGELDGVNDGMENDDDNDDDIDENDNRSLEGGSPRFLRKRARTARPTKAPTVPPDVPAGGCPSVKAQRPCLSSKNCYWIKNSCRFTSKAVTRVIFVGNSFTIRNNLPRTFQNVAKSFGKPTEAYMSAAGSMTLGAHASSSVTMGVLEDVDWHTVVLQEQSAFLSFPAFQFYQNTLPYGLKLYEAAKDHVDHVVLYETWGYRTGNPGMFTGYSDSYSNMQDRLKFGYESLQEYLQEARGNGTSADVSIAYVGEAWRAAFPKFETKLYDPDYRHPYPHGTYLAACVMYAQIFKASPVGSKYKIRGVSSADARSLQQIAAQVVLGLP